MKLLIDTIINSCYHGDIMKINSMKSSAEFAAEIEKIVRTNNVEYLDAIISYAEKHNVEVETVASLVKQNSSLKLRLQTECEQINLVEKTATLPL